MTTTTLSKLGRSLLAAVLGCALVLAVDIPTAEARDRAVFEYGYDTYKFANDSKNFQKRAGETYTITGDYRDLLFKGNTSSENAAINEELAEEWGGSCFGMASVLSLVRAHNLEPRFFQSSARRTNDFDIPVRNEAIRNMINYYQLMQFVGSIKSARGNYSKSNEAANNRALIKALDDNRYPIVFGIDIYRNGRRDGGHALVAYDYHNTTGGYAVDVWDPNHRTTKISLFVSRDFQDSHFRDGYEWERGGYSTFVKYAIPAEGTLSRYRNLQQGLRSMGRSNGYQTVGVQALAETAEPLTLAVNYDSFTIESSAGALATVVNGNKAAGDLDISDGDYLNEPNFEFNIHFEVPRLAAGETYTITPVAEATTPEPQNVDPEVPMPETPLETKYSTELLDATAGVGFYSAVDADASGVFTFAADGALTSNLDEGAAEQKVSVTSNATDAPWTTLSAEGCVDTLTVDVEGADEATIVADEPCALAVTASNLYNEATLEVAGESFAVDTKPTGEVAIAADGASPQTAELGHSVVFYTGEEGAIDTLTGIAQGAAISRPADPTEPDREFLGWYTAPDGGEPYDFAQPVTADLTLYAHWSEPPADEVEMHRLYNPWTGEHLYTASVAERNAMTDDGWQYEGVMWTAPTNSATPIYRLYNPYNGDHHYARTQTEYEVLQQAGWQGEGVAFHSVDADVGVPIYRLFNPYVHGPGAHHYVASDAERSENVSQGWVEEGIGWYGL